MIVHARRAGVATPSLAAVERRRMQLWLVFFVVLIGFSTSLVLMSYWDAFLPDSVRDLANLNVLRSLFLATILAFCVYVVEKERHLGKITRTLIDERVMNAALTNRVSELANLAEVGRAVNSELDTSKVLDMILSTALDMLEASEGTIMLLERDRNVLRAVNTRPADIDATRIAPEVVLGEGIPGWVGQNCEPLLVSREHDPELFNRLVSAESGVHSAMSVPLVHKSELLGVLAVNETAGARHFNEYDLRALGLFAENAAVAISNARLFEAERAHVAKLQDLDRQRSEFVASVSHELRSPLTSILGSVRTLQKKGQDLPQESLDELLAVIERQSERLMALISDILFASRIDAGEQRLRQDEVLIPEVVDEVIKSVRARDPLGRLTLASKPSHAFVLGDPTAVQQILTNLIDNALKYAPGDTPVTLSVTESGDEVAVTVSDHGPGIGKHDLPHIFERYRQVGNSARAGGGVGLGLYITANLVAALGGRIWVQSEEGKGAAFTFTLPILRKEEPALPSERLVQ